MRWMLLQHSSCCLHIQPASTLVNTHDSGHGRHYAWREVSWLTVDTRIQPRLSIPYAGPRLLRLTTPALSPGPIKADAARPETNRLEASEGSWDSLRKPTRPLPGSTLGSVIDR